MKELAEALKAKAGLRMRQGVVSAVDGSTVSVLIGGSTVAVDGVHHLNSVAPQVGEVVWIASDGADLWILGTHGAPPPIDLARLPAFDAYFLAADPAGDPDPPEGLVVTALATGLLVRWDLSPEAIWRRWDIEVDLDDEFPAPATVSTSLHVNTVPLAAESGPWYVRVRAWNTRDEASEWVTAPGSYAIPARTDWSAMPQITETKIADGAISTPKLQAESVTAAKVDVEDLQAAIVTAEVVNALELNAGSIAAGTIDTARLNVGAILSSEITAAHITGGNISGVTVTGGTVRTSASGKRTEIGNGYAGIRLYSGVSGETSASILSDVYDTGAYLALTGPDKGHGAAYIQLISTPDLSSLSLRSGGWTQSYITITDDGSINMAGGTGAGQGVFVNCALTIAGGIQGDARVSGLVKARVPSCSILRTSDGTIGNNTDVYPSLTKSATVEWDTDGFFDSGSPAGITIPVAGVYLLDLSFCWAANATGWRSIGIVVGSDVVARERIPAPGNALCIQQVSCVRELAANDVVKMYCSQTSGGNLSMKANAYAPRLAATWLRQAT